jgi:4a-hydroxytetrahydrobiopterin dehydratase
LADEFKQGFDNRAVVLVRDFGFTGVQTEERRADAPGGRQAMGRDNEACSLANRECVPCQGGVPPLKGEELAKVMAELDNDWTCVEEHHLEKTFKFPDFKSALAFTNQVGALAEEVGHHPDIHLAWGKVKITVWTHKIDGLAEADFVFAAKTDALLGT